jgi:hypothetical protein
MIRLFVIYLSYSNIDNLLQIKFRWIFLLISTTDNFSINGLLTIINHCDMKYIMKKISNWVKKYTPFHSQNENYKYTCTFNFFSLTLFFITNIIVANRKTNYNDLRTVSLNKTNCSYLINRTHLIVLNVVLRPVFTVFRLLTDFVCLYSCEFGLSLYGIVRSSVILLLPLFGIIDRGNRSFRRKSPKLLLGSSWS